MSRESLAAALGLDGDDAQRQHLADLADLGITASTVRRALSVGLSLAEVRAWARFMERGDLETCLDAGLSLDEFRATYASKRLPPRHVLDRLIAIRTPHAA